MKIISEILGNLKSRDFVSKEVDFFDLEWFETTKKILRKNTRNGDDVAVRILKEKFNLTFSMFSYYKDNNIRKTKNGWKLKEIQF